MKGIIVDVEPQPDGIEIAYVCYETLRENGVMTARMFKRIRGAGRAVGRPRGKNPAVKRRKEVAKAMIGFNMEQLEQVAGLVERIKNPPAVNV